MLKITRSSSPFIITVCALLVIQFIGCGEDTDESGTSETPPLPPDESMTVDLSLFDEQVQASPGAATLLTMKNFANAVARVVIVNSAIAAAVTPPAALFAAARAHEPVQQDDGSWLWSYSVRIEYVTFTANLTCVTAGDTNYWSMKVSTDAPLHPVTDLEWYKGTSTQMNTSGSWQFFDLQTPDEQNPTVKIDWSVKLIKEEAELTIENVNTRSEYMGDVLRYNAIPKMCSMSFDDASAGETWEIVWNTETGEGSITVPGYNNGEKACWDTGKQDVPCN